MGRKKFCALMMVGFTFIPLIGCLLPLSVLACVKHPLDFSFSVGRLVQCFGTKAVSPSEHFLSYCLRSFKHMRNYLSNSLKLILVIRSNIFIFTFCLFIYNFS